MASVSVPSSLTLSLYALDINSSSPSTWAAPTASAAAPATTDTATSAAASASDAVKKETVEKEASVKNATGVEDHLKFFKDQMEKITKIFRLCQPGAPEFKKTLDTVFNSVLNFCPTDMPVTRNFYAKWINPFKEFIVIDADNQLLFKNLGLPVNPISIPDRVISEIFKVDKSILERTKGLRPFALPNFTAYPIVKADGIQKWIFAQHPDAPQGSQAKHDEIALIFRAVINESTGQATGLKKLKLRGDGLSAAYLRGILAASPDLAELELDTISPLAVGAQEVYVYSLYDEGRPKEELQARNDEDERLFIEINGAALSRLLAPLQHLRILKVAHCEWFTLDTLRFISRSNPALEHIYCPHLLFDADEAEKNKMIEKVAKMFPHLKSFTHCDGEYIFKPLEDVAALDNAVKQLSLSDKKDK